MVVAVELYPDDDWVWMLIADPRRPHAPTVERIKISSEELALAAELVRSAELTTVAQSVVLSLCSRLLAKIQPYCEKAKALVLAPHGLLHHLPLPTAPILSGVPLVESTITTVLPSTSFLNTLGGSGKPHQTRPDVVTILLGPDIQGDAAVSGFGEAFAGDFGESVGNVDFRIERRPTKVPTGSSVIIAAHGQAAGPSAGSGRLMMANRLGRAEWLPAEDLIAGLGRIDFAFLAVCRSSTSGVRLDDEPLGIVWPFLASGCKAVVAGLWDVTPVSAAVMASRFFSGIFARESAGTAFGKAVAVQRKDPRFTDFRDWGGFLLYGDWSWRITG